MQYPFADLNSIDSFLYTTEGESSFSTTKKILRQEPSAAASKLLNGKDLTDGTQSHAEGMLDVTDVQGGNDVGSTAILKDTPSGKGQTSGKGKLSVPNVQGGKGARPSANDDGEETGKGGSHGKGRDDPDVQRGKGGSSTVVADGTRKGKGNATGEGGREKGFGANLNGNGTGIGKGGGRKFDKTGKGKGDRGLGQSSFGDAEGTVQEHHGKANKPDKKHTRRRNSKSRMDRRGKGRMRCI